MNTPIIITKPKEKIMTNKDAITAIIIMANSDMGSPNMTARFRMFL